MIYLHLFAYINIYKYIYIYTHCKSTKDMYFMNEVHHKLHIVFTDQSWKAALISPLKFQLANSASQPLPSSFDKQNLHRLQGIRVLEKAV